MKRIATITLLTLALGACTTQPPGLHLVLYDGSASGIGNRQLLSQVVEQWMRHPGPAGSRLELLLLGHGLEAAQPLHSIEVPARWGTPVREKKAEWRRKALRDFDKRLRELPCPQGCGSGIAAGIWSAAERLRAAPANRPKSLTLITDLREWSAELARIGQGRPLPEAREFLGRIKKQGLLPQLRGLSLRICGVHSQSFQGEPWRATDTAALQAIWRAFFQAAGQPRVVFHADCPSGEVE